MFPRSCHSEKLRETAVLIASSKDRCMGLTDRRWDAGQWPLFEGRIAHPLLR
jgi:hypothetical protein